MRLVAPEEEIYQIKSTVCIDVDTFYLHLSSVLAHVAKEQTFFMSEVHVKYDAVKTMSGGRALALLNRMGVLTQRWASNMSVVLTLMQATVAYEAACPASILYDDVEGVVTPRKGFDDKLHAALQKAVTEKAVLQLGLTALHHEFCATKSSFAKSDVLWFHHAVTLKAKKYRHLPGFVSRRQVLQPMQVQ